jgi:hypothetical protein
MTVIETLTQPRTLVLLIFLVLSLGVALRMAGPIALQIPHTEIPAISLQIGNVPAVAAPPRPPISRKHHSTRPRPKARLRS